MSATATTALNIPAPRPALARQQVHAVPGCCFATPGLPPYLTEIA